jgi:tripartite-type tricarboxylate transporter receptor subunit TctC
MERLLAYWIVGMACLAAGPSAASAAYPSQPVKIVIQAAAGNGPDALARLIADRLTALWNQQVLVINRPGAGGLIAAQAAASATPDGYTLYMPSSSTFLVLPASHGKLPFDLERDFEPIGLVAKSPIVIAVAPALGVRSVPDLIAVARQRPGLLYAALNRGTLPHVISELFQRRAGIQMTYVPYSGTPQALNDILGGRLSIIFDGMGALSGAMEAGHVKAIAITSATRLAHLPDLATVSETLPDFTLMAWTPGVCRSARGRPLTGGITTSDRLSRG